MTKLYLLLLLPVCAYGMDTSDVERSVTITEVFEYYVRSYSPTLPRELEHCLKDRMIAVSMMRHSDFIKWKMVIEESMRKNMVLPYEAHAFVYDLLGQAAQDLLDDKDRVASRMVLDNVTQLQELTLRLASSERKARIAALSNIGTAVLTAGVTGVVTLLMKK